MLTRSLIALAAIAVALAGVQLSSAAPIAQSGTVASIYDGDTLTLTSGERIRLLQIDTPEPRLGRVLRRAARKRPFSALAPIGSRVSLESDARLDQVDRYGRLLRYVHRGSLNVNLQLVKRGAAAPYFYGGDTGKYASRLLVGGAASEGGEARPLEGLPEHAARPLPCGRNRAERPSDNDATPDREV